MSNVNNDNNTQSGSSTSQSGLKILAGFGVFMLIGIMFLAWLGTPKVQPAVGQAITKLDLAPLVFADAPFDESKLKGKVTVLHFWGTWCPPCREEFPGFAKLANELAGNEGVQFVSISSSQGPEYDLDYLAQATKEFLNKHQTNVPTYADTVGLSRMQLAMLMPDGSLPYPTTIVADRDGVIAGVWIGFSYSGMKEVGQKIEELLHKS